MDFYHSINHLVYERATRQPDDVVLGIPDQTLKYTKYTFKELDVAATLLAKHYVNSRILPGRTKGDFKSRLVVGFLSQSGFDYVVNELALSRLGYCILLISPNNSPAAIAHLLNQTNAQNVIAAGPMIPVVQSALSKLPEGFEAPKLIAQPLNAVYDGSSIMRNWEISWEYPLDFEQERELPFVIIHSSGSTGHPKPIPINHRAGVANYAQHFGYRAFTTLPLYHNHGHSNLYRAIYSGQPLYFFPTGLLPMTADNVLALLSNPDCDAEAVYAVPLVIKFLAESARGISILRGMKLVMFGGSALPAETGDKLVSEGVRLVGQMGSTETGLLGTSARDFENDKEWNYFRTTKHLQKYYRFDDQGDGTYELVVLDGYPSKVMSNQPDGSYKTKDLFSRHSILDGAWKFCGRLDDTLVMVNGEKTNPVPIELTLGGESPYIADAIVFGAGRTQIGALILPSELGRDKTPGELQSLIAPALALANADAPSHSQLSPEAIAFLPYGTQIPRADKGSPIRARTYIAFKNVIDDVYQRLEGEIDEGVVKRPIGSLDETKALVLEVVEDLMGGIIEGLTDRTDLFSFGLDSLQTTRIRNAIQRRVDLRGHKLSSNFVFEHPSIDEIARRLIGIVSGNSAELDSPRQGDLMLALVQKYSAVFTSESRETTENLNGLMHERTGKRYVVLSGSTGSLGAYLLSQFLDDGDVERVYCLARASSHGAADERVAHSMVTRGLDNAFQRRRHKVVCLATDFAKENLGLPTEKYKELRNNVTLVIHSAWPVNCVQVNLGITSFEPHIAGAVNLMRLALQSRHPAPAKFYFCSSVSAVFAWRGPGDVPEAITDDPDVAQQMGYARSKWVMEKLCELASKASPLRARVLRIGQLVGDSGNGIWNETEAISLMLKGAQTIGALPALDESPAWLPVDVAARVIYELASFPEDLEGAEPDSLCWNIVQPIAVPWSEILGYLQGVGMKFECVPRREWVDRLRKSDPDPVRNPTIKLLSFFEGKYDYDDDSAPKKYSLITEKTRARSRALREAPYPNADLVAKWVQSWRRTAFLD